MNQQSAQSDRKPLKRTRAGRVTSDRCDKTRKVEVTFLQRHGKYGKFLRRRSVFHVHDPENVSHQGDTVLIAPCRPISKTKSWRLVRVLETAVGREDTASTVPATGSE
jgi:small subunit ribosomal protein S17